VRAIAGEELVAELVVERDRPGKHLVRHQALEDVVVAPIPVTTREAEHARDGIGLEHGTDDVGRRSEPVGRRPALSLEVERGERAVGAYALEHLLGDLGVLGEDAPRAQADHPAEPRVPVHRDERESLVVRLEDLPTLVQLVAPRRLVAGDAGVQHEIVGSPCDGQRVELDRPQATEDLHDSGVSRGQRSRRREELPRDEEAACGFRGDLHRRDASDRAGNGYLETCASTPASGRGTWSRSSAWTSRGAYRIFLFHMNPCS
jgi:hypothetical protein